MTPSGDKIRVTARISKELNTKLHQHYTNLAPAIIEGLELLVSTKEGRQTPHSHHVGTNGTSDNMAPNGAKDKEIEFLKEQIRIKDSQLERQAYSLQSLIQVNSALNMKLLPEKTPENKGPEQTINQNHRKANTPEKPLEIILEEELATPEPAKEPVRELEEVTEHIETLKPKKAQNKSSENPAPKKRASRKKEPDFDDCVVCETLLKENHRSNRKTCSTECRLKFNSLSKEEKEELIRKAKERQKKNRESKLKENVE